MIAQAAALPDRVEGCPGPGVVAHPVDRGKETWKGRDPPARRQSPLGRMACCHLRGPQRRSTRLPGRWLKSACNAAQHCAEHTTQLTDNAAESASQRCTLSCCALDGKWHSAILWGCRWVYWVQPVSTSASPDDLVPGIAGAPAFPDAASTANGPVCVELCC